ncbi:MAG TPA: site-2 protease family protein [Anaerolineaceae bacterium]|nr:site-2 protease family protein [Anaerolineaceae bacterium]
MLGLEFPLLFTRLIALIMSLTVHEFAHAWSAFKFGDDTAQRAGRLSFNPLHHLDPVGSLMMLLVGFGWAKPVPINPYTLQRSSPGAVMWVSLAGPFSNFLLAILSAIPFRMGWVDLSQAWNVQSGALPTLPYFLLNFMVINLSLMLFNLLPIAPLDGEKMALYLLPTSWARGLASVSHYGPFILLGFILLGNYAGIDILGAIMGPALINLLQLLLGIGGLQ